MAVAPPDPRPDAFARILVIRKTRASSVGEVWGYSAGLGGGMGMLGVSSSVAVSGLEMGCNDEITFFSSNGATVTRSYRQGVRDCCGFPLINFQERLDYPTAVAQESTGFSRALAR